MDKNKLILPISILLGCIILGSFFYAIQVSKRKSIEKQSQVNNFDMDTQCAKQAQTFFDYWETDPVAKQNDELFNHYNTKLNKCFVKIKEGISSDNRYYTEYLFDAVEKKQYGNFMVEIPTWGKPIICDMLDKFCQTRDEYDNFVKQYMEN